MIAASAPASGQNRGRDQVQTHSSITIGPSAPLAPGEEALQLEVYVNGRSTQQIAAFRLDANGRMSSPRSELEQVGIKVPASYAPDAQVPLDRLTGVTYNYDEATQIIRIAATSAAQRPTVIRGEQQASPVPERPPLGAVLNYTLFASGDSGTGGPRFAGASGEFATRVFGRFGLIENNVVARVGEGSRLLRLDSRYIYEDPVHLMTFQAGDLISGGFSWTRPIRMGGVQVRRSFGLRPDLVTLPLPSLTGSAAAPSTLDLFVDKVRTLSTTVPQGPYEIDNPPVVYGSGEARVVLQDALGRQTVSTTPFYAAPELLRTGLTDFSAELSYPRRNYGIKSTDYDGRLAYSLSLRRGIAPWLTLQSHIEGAGKFAAIGGGAIAVVGNVGIASVAVSASRAPGESGALIDLAFDSRMSFGTLRLRTQRTIGDYEDIASWTAVTPPNGNSRLSIFGQPMSLDQVSFSLPLPWQGASFGASAVQIKQVDEARSRVANVSYTQNFGRLSLFASAVKDFGKGGGNTVFVGLSMPLGGRANGSVGLTHARGATSGYVEAARQSDNRPGSFGWSVRASGGEREQAQAILRYNSRFAHFEGTGYYSDGHASATALMEGGIALVDGALEASRRLDNAFAMVDAGAPDVTIYKEHRKVGETGASGKLLVPNLAAFVSNRIEIDPAGLPIDAEVASTEVETTPFSRVPTLVRLGVKTDTRSALVTLADGRGKPLPVGTAVALPGAATPYVVGYDGATFIEHLAARNTIRATLPDGTQCRAAFDYQPEAGSQVHIGPIVCAAIEAADAR